MSSWAKQTVLLAYPKSDLQKMNVSMVKSQDAAYMADSLSFKGGVFLDHILGVWSWKSHTTVFKFYFK